MATFRLLTSNYSLCEGSSGRVSVVLQTAGILDQTVKVNVRTLDSGTATGIALETKQKLVRGSQ